MQIAFIGGGVMAEAIIGGIIESKIANAQDVHVGEPVEARRAHLENTYGLTAHANNRDALEDAGLSVLAVKPQSLPYVLPDLKGKLSKDNALLSIVAGATMKTLTDGLDHKAVIRVMPNTPAQIGAGMSVWTAAPLPNRFSALWAKSSTPTMKSSSTWRPRSPRAARLTCFCS